MLTSEELKAHPEFPHVVWKLDPAREGKVEVAKDRGGPIKLAWEIHGSGPVHLVWLMGLGSYKSGWQRQTKDFGHDQASKYSCLIFDNRGIGESDKPLARYSTSEMAKDTIELLDHVGWTSKRELHVIGISMGGMIAQELGMLIPERICSLTLLSTAAQIKNTVGYFENLRNRINLLIPKNIDVQLVEVTNRLFGPVWVDQPDEEGSFPTNRDRWGAQELHKRMNTEGFTRKGFLCQIIAAGWHYKSPEQLKWLGDHVGRDRIFVIHGTEDNMITFPHIHVLTEALTGPGLTSRIFEGSGHVIPGENRREFREIMSKHIDRTEALSKA